MIIISSTTLLLIIALVVAYKKPSVLSELFNIAILGLILSVFFVLAVR